MRRRALRRLAGWALLLALVGGVSAPHTNSPLHWLLDDGPLSSGPDQVLTTHNPLSRGVHLHAAIPVDDDGCLACHFQRLAGVPKAPPAPIYQTPRPFQWSAAKAAVFSRTLLASDSRAPPQPLS